MFPDRIGLSVVCSHFTMTDDNQTNRTDCYFCGSTDTLQTHHICPRRYSGSDRDRNLVDLCFDCHMKIERLYDNRFYHNFAILQIPTFIDAHDATIVYGADEKFGPERCPECDRYGPFTTVRPAPATVTAWECIRCEKVVVDGHTVEYPAERGLADD